MEKDFSEIVYLAQKFQNDLKHIKLHAVGIQYDTIVDICEKLIKELDEEIEDFSNWSFENGCPVDNPSNLKSHLLADPLDGEAYDFNDFTEYLNGSLIDYIEEIDSLEECWMAGYSHYWTQELKRNEMRRFVKNTGPILSPEELGDYSAALAPYMVEVPENDNDTEFNKPLPPVDWSAMDFVNNTQNTEEDEEEAEDQIEENEAEESEENEEEQESLKEAKMSDEEKKRLDKSVNLNGWTEKDDDDEEENEERKAVIEKEQDEEFKDATL